MSDCSAAERKTTLLPKFVKLSSGKPPSAYKVPSICLADISLLWIIGFLPPSCFCRPRKQTEVHACKHVSAKLFYLRLVLRKNFLSKQSVFFLLDMIWVYGKTSTVNENAFGASPSCVWVKAMALKDWPIPPLCVHRRRTNMLRQQILRVESYKIPYEDIHMCGLPWISRAHLVWLAHRMSMSV